MGSMISPGETIAIDGGTIRIPPIAYSAQLVADWRSKPIPQITRNLFRSELTAPPPPSPMPQPAPSPVEPEPIVLNGPTGAFWLHLERALAARVDRERFREQLHSELMDDAASVKIQSTITGERPQVLLGGKVFEAGESFQISHSRTGQMMRAFRVESIDADGLIVSRDGKRVRIFASTKRSPILLGEVPHPSAS